MNTRTRLPAVLVVAVCSVGSIPGTQAASFLSLGTLGPGEWGYSSSANAVSADGRVVVGSSTSANGVEAFRWTATDGMVGLGNLGGIGFDIGAYAVSADGSVVVGSAASATGQDAFRWTAADGMVSLGYIDDSHVSSRAYGVSGDGSVVVGESGVGAGIRQPFRWTADDGMQLLGSFDGDPNHTGSGTAIAASADGTVLVGHVGQYWDGEAFYWTPDSGMTGLGRATGTTGMGRPNSSARAVTPDGSVIVGHNYELAMRWTEASGMFHLGPETGFGSAFGYALGVSADGGIVIGQAGGEDNEQQAFLWTEDTGMVRLFDWLVANGATGLEGWTLHSATGISSNGQWVVGSGRDAHGNIQAFIADITPVPVPAAVWMFASGVGALGWFRRRAKPSLTPSRRR